MRGTELCQRPPSKPRTADFGVLAEQVREAGLLDRRFGYYGLMIPLTVAAFGVGFAALILIGSSWWALGVAGFLGLAFTQLGFVGHDAGHHEVFRSRRANRLLGLAVGNVLIGMSFGWWVPKHSAHHAHPNEVGRDPDVGAAPSPRRCTLTGERSPGRPSRFMTKWQAPLFFPLMVLRSTGIYVLGIQRLVRQRNRAAVLEGALLAMHAALYLAVVFWVLSPLKAVAFIAHPAGCLLRLPGVQLRPEPQGHAHRRSRPETELRPAPGHHLPERGRRLVHQRGRSAASTSRLSTTCSRACPDRTCPGPRAL